MARVVVELFFESAGMFMKQTVSFKDGEVPREETLKKILSQEHQLSMADGMTKMLKLPESEKAVPVDYETYKMYDEEYGDGEE